LRSEQDREADIRELLQLRHELHREPELSGAEVKSGQKLKNFLSSKDPDRLITGLGGHGLLAVYSGNKPGKTILLRCETDAVPVIEDLQLPYSSTTRGIAHKCGHDGHMAILAGVASALQSNPPERGSVLLLFQPAEETGEGAALVLADGKFNEFQPDMVFAMHNLPGFPLGSIVTGTGVFASASRGLIIKLKGGSSHAAEPGKGISPAPAAASLIQKFPELCELEDGNIVTLVHCIIGKRAFGTSPGNAVVMATLRAPSAEAMTSLSRSVLAEMKRISAIHHLKSLIEWTEEFPVTVNSPEIVSVVRESAETLGLEIVSPETPFLWSEDFGHFSNRYPGALFGLGAGTDSPPLHNPAYDFPDCLIDTGISIFRTIIDRALDR